VARTSEAVRSATAGIGLLAGLVVWVLSALDLIAPGAHLLGVIVDRFAPEAGLSPDRIESAVRGAFERGELIVSSEMGLYLVLIGGVAVVAGSIAVLIRRRPSTPASVPAGPTTYETRTS
jgi:hypothetical protein